ncbi:MAG TPA: isovaleryl-CoA dehydrogenase [Nevskiales bacterium]|nr:isovaleryl-CoA dehydrogenase [Nevskiales bacterium]
MLAKTEPPFGVTHEVFNQPPPLENVNFYAQDLPLREAVAREGGAWGETRLMRYGDIAGHELIQLGFQANQHKPVLKTHDRYGHRIDEVEFHPAYHRLMQVAIEHELPTLAWRDPRPGAHVVSHALSYLHSQVEAGTGCPLTMTYACIPALRHQPDVAKVWEPRILSTEYDPRCLPAEQKRGVTIGMGMTEKQGGSDVRANTTRAWPLGAGGPGQAYELVGHKWFFSAPMCDAFLVLAQAERGLSCFLLPRWRPDGSRNAIHIQRLKDKLGNWSNASSEVEFHRAWAVMVGEEGRGVPTIIEMVAHTRLDCMAGSAALMRQALTQAIHHCAHRSAFGRALIDQPLMQNVLADLALESEAALALMLRVARAFDESARDEPAALFARIATGVGKYWICKRTPVMVNEAQECLGGAGYVEEHILPRLYREAPLNSIWEGSGNIQCLDVLRAMSREPGALEVFLAELQAARGAHALFDAALADLEDELARKGGLETRARRVVEKMAVTLQAALLLRAGNRIVADAFCVARLGTDRGRAFGTLPEGIDCCALIERSRIVTS